MGTIAPAAEGFRPTGNWIMTQIHCTKSLAIVVLEIRFRCVSVACLMSAERHPGQNRQIYELSLYLVFNFVFL